jgi:hypothetical protein
MKKHRYAIGMDEIKILDLEAFNTTLKVTKFIGPNYSIIENMTGMTKRTIFGFLNHPETHKTSKAILYCFILVLFENVGHWDGDNSIDDDSKIDKFFKIYNSIRDESKYPEIIDYNDILDSIRYGINFV